MNSTTRGINAVVNRLTGPLPSTSQSHCALTTSLHNSLSSLSLLINQTRFSSSSADGDQGSPSVDASSASGSSAPAQEAASSSGAESASSSDPHRSLFDKLRADKRFCKFTFDSTVDETKEKFNYNRPGVYGQQPMQDTAAKLQDIGPVSESDLAQLASDPLPLLMDLQRALIAQDRGDAASEGVLRKLAQVQLDNMAKEGLLTKDEATGVPYKTPGVVRTAWGADPARHTLWYQFDCTMGKIPNALRNAYLSEEAKEQIYQLHKADPALNSHKALAEQFKVRPERIAAIVALRELEHRAREAGLPLDDAWHSEMENEERASGQQFYSEGTGERHWEWLPTDPSKDKGLTWEQYMANCEKVSKENGDLNYEEFIDRLNYNLGRTAPSVTRGPQRFAGYPKKPEGGYSLVVRPMSGRKDFEPFVASPGSDLRPLSEDERVYLDRKLRGFARSNNRLTFQGFDNAPKRAVLAREAQQRWEQKAGKNKR